NTGEHVNWHYYEMDNSSSVLTGAGDYAGQTLNLAHMPANFEFGFQIGLGANARTLDHGMSGWFTHTGSHDGHGDFNVNTSCSDCQDSCDLTAECDGTDITIPNGNDGSLSPIISGSGNYSIEWTGPNGYYSTSLTINNLTA